MRVHPLFDGGENGCRRAATAKEDDARVDWIAAEQSLGG
jgi:hypothetical protein